MTVARVVLVVLLMTSGAVADPKAKAPKAGPSPAQLASFKAHMKAGYAAEKQKKWAKAVTEFEAALAIQDADQRALAELGWSAMNAGDFVKARRADEQAVQIAIDKNVKAAALYNLGTVEQKSGNTAAAAQAFVTSLSLRPHKTVAAALASLGEAAKTEVPFCAAGQKPCACVMDAAFGFEEPDDPETTCTLSTDKPPVPGFHIYRVKRVFHSEEYDYLLDEHDQLVAVIKGTYEYRWGAVSNDLTLDKAEVKTIGGHQVLRIETTDSTMETSGDADTMDVSSSNVTKLTLCVLGKPATRCPLRDVPIASSLDEKKGAKLDVSVADNGVATVKLVSGASDAQIQALVGPHKLW